ncbi:MAG TPA: SgcJ/EcaC family oxidoreductase [Candidatus Solibacter sp.]|nr:SgcJ/EcaC family oxidoreductase [Candidatus Solibacter sp.]
MPAHKLEEVHDLLARALNAGDADAVISLYEPEAILAPQPGQILSGRAAIREALTGYLAQKPKFTLHSRSIIQAGEIALLRSRWTIRETDADGKTIEYEVKPTLVMRRQPDRTWQVVIDNPSGDE